MHTCPHLVKECILPPLLAVPCDILENILQVPLSSPGIKVLGMTKEEQHKRKVEQLMEFLQLPLVALLSRAIRNDLCHQFAKRKEQIIGITGRRAWTKQWWTTLVHCVKHEKIFEQIYKQTMAAVHGDRTLVVVCDTALGATSL
jgi:hypothetical protein